MQPQNAMHVIAKPGTNKKMGFPNNQNLESVRVALSISPPDCAHTHARARARAHTHTQSHVYPFMLWGMCVTLHPYAVCTISWHPQSQPLLLLLVMTLPA